jgi:hypothetical protein
VKKLVRIGLVALVPPLLGSAFFTPQVESRDDLSSPTIQLSSPASQEQQESDSDGPVDLLGNEVTDAVAKYKFDATGSLYETHSPQTELPKLGAPKS